MTSATNQTAPPDVCQAIHTARRLLLVGHVTPDADCLGSMGALAGGLRAAGKHVHASLPAGSVSRRLAFLAEMAELRPATHDEMKSCDAILVVDTAKAPRVNLDGKLEAFPGVPVVNIDHHDTNVGFGSHNWVDGRRSSAAEMVYETLRALDYPISRQTATLLYAGIHSDTQGFSLPNTTPRSLEVGHDLALTGVDIPHLCERLNRSYTPGEFKLMAIIYSNTRVSDDARLAWSTADHAEITGAGCTAADIDDQVNIPRSIEGIFVAILFTEGNKGKVRMNFRGERGTNVLELARKFGGGGHTESAGAILDGDIAGVSARVLAEAKSFVAAL